MTISRTSVFLFISILAILLCVKYNSSIYQFYFLGVSLAFLYEFLSVRVWNIDPETKENINIDYLLTTLRALLFSFQSWIFLIGVIIYELTPQSND